MENPRLYNVLIQVAGLLTNITQEGLLGDIQRKQIADKNPATMAKITEILTEVREVADIYHDTEETDQFSDN
jgi:tRNA U54 and U55 pseudouridine synthase Pus10